VTKSGLCYFGAYTLYPGLTYNQQNYGFAAAEKSTWCNFLCALSCTIIVLARVVKVGTFGSRTSARQDDHAKTSMFIIIIIIKRGAYPSAVSLLSFVTDGSFGPAEKIFSLSFFTQRPAEKIFTLRIDLYPQQKMSERHKCDLTYNTDQMTVAVAQFDRRDICTG
jgi:hypothetical protein